MMAMFRLLFIPGGVSCRKLYIKMLIIHYPIHTLSQVHERNNSISKDDDECWFR